MSQGKVKIYKNPNRADQASYKSYVPQYQVLGMEPVEYKSQQVPANTPVAQNSSDNPRTKVIGLRQAQAEVADNKKVSIPNVGNNVEQIWSGVDSQIVDDFDDFEDVDTNQPMIDNNDYVTDSALGLSSSETTTESKEIRYGDELINVVESISEGQYLLLVNGVSICHGDLANIQEQATDLIFGEHPICDGVPTPVDNIIIIKKCKVKLGLFLE